MAPLSLGLPFSFLGSSTQSRRAMVDFLPWSSSASSTRTPVSSAKKAWLSRSLISYLEGEWFPGRAQGQGVSTSIYKHQGTTQHTEQALPSAGSTQVCTLAFLNSQQMLRNYDLICSCFLLQYFKTPTSPKEIIPCTRPSARQIETDPAEVQVNVQSASETPGSGGMRGTRIPIIQRT